MTNITYTSSDGTEFDLMADMSFRLKKAQFHNFEFQPDVTALQFGERVERWRQGAATYAAQILFKGPRSARMAALDTFHKAIERDIICKSPGILTWGNSYISAYIRSSGTYPGESNDTETYNDVEIYCPSPAWITEQRIIIEPIEQQQSLRETDIQYAPSYGYDYSYMKFQDTSKNIYVDHFVPCDFKAALYGPVAAVDISMGNLSLKVNHAVPAGGRMVIDTRETVEADRHCYLEVNGQMRNCFNDRDPESTLLGKIEPGFNKVVYGRTTRLELTIYRERSEPGWTN